MKKYLLIISNFLYTETTDNELPNNEPKTHNPYDILLERIKTIIQRMLNIFDWLKWPFNRAAEQQQKLQQYDFELEKLKIFIGTWNMHGKVIRNFYYVSCRQLFILIEKKNYYHL